jgi:glycerol-3-phosphate dehydrogenase
MLKKVGLFAAVLGGAYMIKSEYSEKGYITARRRILERAKAMPELEQTRCKVGAREHYVEKLRLQSTDGGEPQYDVIVVGGGVTGAGTALDFATRGLRTLLVERGDFSSGTSSHSSSLIHGGVRYAEKAVLNLDKVQFDLVVEALQERSTLLTVAPHLTRELPILLPIYSYWQLIYFTLGTKFYDWLAGDQGIETSSFLSRSKALERFPMLREDELCGALVYYDGHHDDARTNMSLVLTAAERGADVVNYADVVGLAKDDDGRVCGVRLVDRLADGAAPPIEVRAAGGVVNATGAWTDVLRRLDDAESRDVIVPSAGTHVVLPDFYSPRDMGMLDPATSDGRVLFFLPWLGATVVGTTDRPCSLGDEQPAPTEEEIEFLLREISRYLSPDVQLRREDVLSAWTGIRPLARSLHADDPEVTQQIARTHQILVSDSGLVSVCGGKLTTYRVMAEDTVDAAVDAWQMEPQHSCRTETTILRGGDEWHPNHFISLIQRFGLDTDVAKHLSAAYGDRADELLSRYVQPTNRRWPKHGVRLDPSYPTIEAEVRWAVREEMARTAYDVATARTRLATLNVRCARQCLPRIVEIMAEELGWSEQRCRDEYTRATQQLKKAYAHSKPGALPDEPSEHATIRLAPPRGGDL